MIGSGIRITDDASAGEDGRVDAFVGEREEHVADLAQPAVRRGARCGAWPPNRPLTRLSRVDNHRATGGSRRDELSKGAGRQPRVNADAVVTTIDRKSGNACHRTTADRTYFR